MKPNREFKSGFAALVGRPNVGKSSLLNTFVGQKLTITSEKPQTTRAQFRGILTGADFQIIWVDTPGIHHSFHKLGDQMNLKARTALEGVDLALWVLDAGTGLTEADRKIAVEIAGVKVPVFIVWNKSDLNKNPAQLESPVGFQRVFQVSARTGAGIATLLQAVTTQLPEGPLYYPPELVTDQPERLIAGELIREEILKFTEDEVPHSIAVQVERMEERANGAVYIEALIYVERDSQKGIVIGAGGERLKKIGQAARMSIEAMLDTKVFLNLWVKIRKDWRNNPAALREFGYLDGER